MPVYDESDGYIEVTVNSADAGDGEPVRLDLYEAHCAYLALCEQHDGDATLMPAWLEWLDSRGVSGISQMTGLKLGMDIIQRVRAVKKKLGWEVPSGTPGWSASTESPPPE